MAKERQVKQQVVIDTTPELAFEALTAASELREWCSAEARTEVRPGGRYELRWESGYRTEGKFTLVEPPHCAAVSWWGSDEPGETSVEFGVAPEDGGVRVTIVHRGFGPGAEWDEAVGASEKGWAIGAENLKSTLETGIDLRIARRPFLGIFPTILDAERAAREGIAAARGIYINNTLEDSAARAAGLAKGDVIVGLGGAETPGYEEFNAALRAHQAGQVVDVELVRGQKRETLPVTLGHRPRVDVGGTAEGLARFVAERYAETDAALQAALEGLSDEEAGCCTEGEWSVKHVLAHLIISERDTQGFLASIALDGWVDTGPGNTAVIPGRLAAVLAAGQALDDLLARFLAYEAETVALLRGLPAETVAHKARFDRICQNMALAPIHVRDHIEQIRNIRRGTGGGEHA